ncbi:adenylosuccinate lyase [Tenacibaculum pacificus]|uniref:adenylosuccinate lyase n=1 Tax=Tenacibaculum pacificus TaxID=3018314 RepID=UPI0022F3DE05|nr:adenylosuccinate lyase [Tenacibaculum pacificus]WBX74495.1 adenylosuccinate lyase [Tenacibaculum pacificus]
MSIDFLISVLHDMKSPTKLNRNNASNIVLAHPKLIKNLVDLTFDVDNKLSIKAAWVLEWICTQHNIDFILPYIDIFTEKISTVHFDSAIRPCAKICENLAIAYTSTSKNKTKDTLTSKNIDAIIETGFDWLITDQKIAVRAYSMTFLFLFGLEKDWVHTELKHLITTKIIHESKACKARGNKILKLLNNKKM